MRDVVAPIFRYRRAGILTALVVLGTTAIIVLLSPKQYEAETKLLVKRERAETLVGANPNASPQPRADVTEDELNSEVELLQGHSLLEQVALRTGLVARSGSSPDASTDRIEVARAVERLHADLKVAPLKRSTFIRVTYRSGDPAQAVRVLNELTQLYLEKHLALHRAPGAYQFFSEQTARFQKELRAAEARLNEYSRREHVVSADVEKANTLQQLAAFEATLQQTRAEVAEATRRLTDLEAQAAITPARQTTQIRTTENATFIRELESSILGLESKRNDMLRKYAPTYPPVVEVEGQLARARAALARVQQSPLTDETTDQNPTHSGCGVNSRESGRKRRPQARGRSRWQPQCDCIPIRRGNWKKSQRRKSI